MREKETEIPTSFCPFTCDKCVRTVCQLWVDDGENLGCAFFFMGVKALKEYRGMTKNE